MQSRFSINTILTPEDRAQALNDLRIFDASLFKSDKLVVPKGVSVKYGKRIFDYLSNQKQIDHEVISKLYQEVVGMNIAEIIIAFEPKFEQIEQIAIWVKQLWGEEFLTQISTDLSMLAGIKVFINGKYVDLSITPLVEQYWNSQKAAWLQRFGII